jgi:hypothetical protein
VERPDSFSGDVAKRPTLIKRSSFVVVSVESVARGTDKYDVTLS